MTRNIYCDYYLLKIKYVSIVNGISYAQRVYSLLSEQSI